jgi:hypothetical protein
MLAFRSSKKQKRELPDRLEKHWIDKHWLGRAKGLLSQRFVKNIP